MKKRVFNIISKSLLILLAGLAYYLFMELTKIRVPCVFYKLTGFYCPGCGITRAAESLLRFDLMGALGYNAGVVLMGPIWLFVLIKSTVFYIRYGKKDESKINKYLLIFTIVFLVVFCIFRNIFPEVISPYLYLSDNSGISPQ